MDFPKLISRSLRKNKPGHNGCHCLPLSLNTVEKQPFKECTLEARLLLSAFDRELRTGRGRGGSELRGAKTEGQRDRKKQEVRAGDLFLLTTLVLVLFFTTSSGHVSHRRWNILDCRWFYKNVIIINDHIISHKVSHFSACCNQILTLFYFFLVEHNS